MTNDIQKTQRDLLVRIQTEGVLAAYEASLAVARDPSAPAPARATASATLFRVAGYFEKREAPSEKQPSEMTPQELEGAIAQAKARLAASRSTTDDDGEDGIFG